MTETRSPAPALVLAFLCVGLAAFASCRARQGVERAPEPSKHVASWSDAVARLDSLPPLPSPVAGMPFWIGGWVGPPVGALARKTWDPFGAAGLDVSMGPLEDRYRRDDNVARLGVLDEGSLFTFVRDDSVHPDETTRPGWEARVEAIVRAYGGHRSLAGYFLADEPAPTARAQWAPIARLLRRLDPAHPAYVNFVGLTSEEALDREARARWRRDLVAALREGELPFFTVDAYPFGNEGGEGARFLATLGEAARVSHETATPFGVVLQFTGHGGLRAVSEGEARYQAMEALAHGASCVIWFTYWTPDPAEEPWRWHGGAVAYDGTPTDRHELLSGLDRDVRLLAERRGDRAMLVAHLGDRLPEGIAADSLSMVPHVDSLVAHAASIGFTGEDAQGSRRYVVVNRDSTSRMYSRVYFDASVDSARILGEGGRGYDDAYQTVRGPAPEIWVACEPGGGAVIATWRSNPRTPSRSGTR